MMIIKLTIVICLIYGQVIWAKKTPTNPTSSLQTATSTISSYLQEITEFLKDVLDAITDLFGRPIKSKTTPSKTTNWSVSNFFRYAKKNFLTGMKVVQDTISVLKIARSTVDDVAPILPNVSSVLFVETLLNRLVPELMNNGKFKKDIQVQDTKNML